jgi:imidazolonepropionase-like amidohydrolase
VKIILTILTAVSPLLAFSQNDNVPVHIIAITHVNVIDATGSPVQPDMTVIISGNKIIGLAKAGKIAIPQNAEILNSKGKYLIPGLWDMHFHALQSVFKSDYRFTLCIANGVTGVREMWAHMDEMPQVNLWRKQFYEQPGTIPRFGSVGTLVDGVPAVWEGSDTATTAESARLLVRKIKASGSDFVKVYDNLPRAAYFALADECKKQNIPFAGHLPLFILFREAADAGQQSIEHLTGLYQAFYHSCPPDEVIKALPSEIKAGSPFVPLLQQALQLCDEKERNEIFHHLAEKQVWQCPTLITEYAIHPYDENLLFNDPRLKYISIDERKRWETRTAAGLKSRTQEQRDKEKIFMTKAMAVISQMKKAGIQFLAGVDIPIHYLYPGFSLHDELALFVKAGLTPMEALQTATLNPAKFLGTTDSLGTIEKGKIADLILLNANPLTDIHNTTRIESVFVNGKYLSKKELQAMLLTVEEAANKK